MRSRLLSIAEAVMKQPVAPFRETAVQEHIKTFCRDRNLPVRQDKMGNLRVGWGLDSRAPALVLEAHMDHPGFVMEKDSRGHRVSAVFHGSVEKSYFKGTPVRVATADGERTGRVVTEPKDILPRGLRMKLELNGPVKRGDIGMWDVPVFRVRQDTLTARACDDLAGCAALLTCLDVLAESGARPNVEALFTVAEEAGLHGALYVCRQGRLPRNAVVVSIETSREWAQARRGDGVVARVGDRGRVFDPPVTQFIMEMAGKLADRIPGFKVQRKLMDGGTCESSVYQAFGYKTGAVCVPLGNYHNRDFARGRIAAERVSIADLTALAHLLVGMSENLGELNRALNPKKPRYREQRGPLGERFMVKA